MEEIMNRVSLSAFAAALLLASPAAILAQEKTMTTSTGMELVWIPPGEFMMGSTPEEREWATGSEGRLSSRNIFEGGEPTRTLIKNGFWLGRTELTLGQWRKFVDATGYVTEAEKRGFAFAPQPDAKGWQDVRGAYWKNPGFLQKDDHPACCIAWNDAAAYCEWLTEQETKSNKLPAGMVCRLPTEAEWEYACRAGTQTKFWWGGTVKGGSGRLNWIGAADGFEFSSPVDHYGVRGRNRFGLSDMLGNAWEWCLDTFDPNQAHPELWKETSNLRPMRGGSFFVSTGSNRCAARFRIGATDTHAAAGFRVCCGIPGGSGQPSQNTAPLVAVVPPPATPQTAPTANPPATTAPATPPQVAAMTKPAFGRPIVPGFSPVKLVEVKANSKKKDLSSGAGNVANFAQSRALTITIRNGSHQPVSGVMVRWGVVKADFTTNKTAAYGKEENMDLRPLETRTLETPSVTATGKQWNYKANEGEKLLGHGVQVLIGDKVVAEEFSPPSVKPYFGDFILVEATK
ncbi:MAG: formylglycine-generating enzyme family protein [Verrucomicrobia bacterium]|nr:formylglycine-generating enzyme family protein [Verrucomicrobiota bacterium]